VAKLTISEKKARVYLSALWICIGSCDVNDQAQLDEFKAEHQALKEKLQRLQKKFGTTTERHQAYVEKEGER